MRWTDKAQRVRDHVTETPTEGSFDPTAVLCSDL